MAMASAALYSARGSARTAASKKPRARAKSRVRRQASPFTKSIRAASAWADPGSLRWAR